MLGDVVQGKEKQTGPGKGDEKGLAVQAVQASVADLPAMRAMGQAVADPKEFRTIAQVEGAIEQQKIKPDGQELAAITSRQKLELIRRLIPGSCTDDEEQEINKMLRTSDVSSLEWIVLNLGAGDPGKGVDYLDSGIDGAEWNDCKKILRRGPRRISSAILRPDGARACYIARNGRAGSTSWAVLCAT